MVRNVNSVPFFSPLPHNKQAQKNPV